METPILTPMQQAIEKLKVEMQKATEQQSPNIASGFHHSITILKTYLPKEQIHFARTYIAGWDRGYKQLPIPEEQYFNQTYKDNGK